MDPADQPEGWISATCNTVDNTYTSFDLWPKIDPLYSSILAIIVLVTLLFHQWMRTQYRNFDKMASIAWKVQIVMTTVSLLDIIVGVMIINSASYPYPWIAAFIRPFYLITTVSILRTFWRKYLIVMKDSAPMVLFIVVYILYFSWMGQRYFSGTKEGVEYFSTFGNSCFNMLVLMTTSNYPDIMLPAYQIYRGDCLYFIIYLVVGLYLLMNLLLAIFYSNFKSRFD
jgi:hypothetical protein